MSSQPAALTVGHISKQLCEPVWKIDYVIKTRKIEPVCRAGHLRVFNEDALEQIVDAIREIDVRMGRHNAAGGEAACE
jgi:hypothetical protein